MEEGIQTIEISPHLTSNALQRGQVWHSLGVRWQPQHVSNSTTAEVDVFDSSVCESEGILGIFAPQGLERP